MAKKKLLEDILHNPARFYRVPGDVLRDRRFADDERGAILKAWQEQDQERGAEIALALSELEGRNAGDGVNHAAE
jgi:hypothetical protein